MKKILTTIFLLTIVFSAIANDDGLKIGDKAPNFSLKDVNGEMVSLSDYDEAKGFIVIFSCNHCPYVIAYEDRIIDLDKKFKSKGYPVIAINPNDSTIAPGDSYSKMILRAEEKAFSFPYLLDAEQNVYKDYGATKTPHVFLLQKKGGDNIVKYIGTIDDNYKDESLVKEKYLENAIKALIAGNNPEPAVTKAIGCSIKD
jgi:peroxiredoxin